MNYLAFLEKYKETLVTIFFVHNSISFNKFGNSISGVICRPEPKNIEWKSISNNVNDNKNTSKMPANMCFKLAHGFILNNKISDEICQQLKTNGFYVDDIKKIIIFKSS